MHHSKLDYITDVMIVGIGIVMLWAGISNIAAGWTFRTTFLICMGAFLVLNIVTFHVYERVKTSEPMKPHARNPQ